MKLKVLQKIDQNNAIFSLILERPENFSFYPGQFLDIEIPVEVSDGRGKVRAFTISSSPTEKSIAVTTKKGVSDFKKAFEKLMPGDFVSASHPAGTFILDESTPAVFIAGGIGITPFRSMLKHAVDRKINTSITLIYSNSSENFLFKEELDTWQKGLPNLKIYYVNTATNGRLDKTKLTTAVGDFVNSIFYLAGSQSMIYGFSKYLQDLGVDEINIRTDSFDGYE